MNPVEYRTARRDRFREMLADVATAELGEVVPPEAEHRDAAVRVVGLVGRDAHATAPPFTLPVVIAWTIRSRLVVPASTCPTIWPR